MQNQPPITIKQLLRLQQRHAQQQHKRQVIKKRLQQAAYLEHLKHCKDCQARHAAEQGDMSGLEELLKGLSEAHVEDEIEARLFTGKGSSKHVH